MDHHWAVSLTQSCQECIKAGIQSKKQSSHTSGVFVPTVHVRVYTNTKHAKSLCSHVRRTQYPNPNTKSAKPIDRYSTAEKVRQIFSFFCFSSNFFSFVYAALCVRFCTRRLSSCTCSPARVYRCLPKTSQFERSKTCKHGQAPCWWEDCKKVFQFDKK